MSANVTVRRIVFILIASAFICAGYSPDADAHRTTPPAKERQAAASEAEVPLLEGLYVLDFPITTKSDLARKYFNQGLVLTYGFDHVDAGKSFMEAASQDPACAMCYWGAALVLGPNINAPMDDADVPRAYELAEKAKDLSKGVSRKEAMLIEALLKRYTPEPVEDRSGLDRAFADAMVAVADAYPDDPDVGVIAAEALMDLHPWDYWTIDGEPRPWTPEIQTRLESIISTNPRHPEALHLYIHLLENSPLAERTVKSADIIVDLVPLSGHLVHMAAHAYLASGLYHDCSRANEKAITVDAMLDETFGREGFYHLFYVPHVEHFLWYCYAAEGRSADATDVSRALAKRVEESMMKEPGSGTVQHYWVMKYYSLVRFGRWKEILAETQPDKGLGYAQGAWHYMRGMAFARTGRLKEAGEELEMLRKTAADPDVRGLAVWDLNKVTDLLAVAAEVLAGELSAERGEFDKAVAHLEKGVSLEESLVFDEPPPWYYPIRQSLGAVLLEAGRAEEAEKVYRRDLELNPETGWSLMGLAESLRAQGKAEAADDVERRFRRAWARSDITLGGSRF